MNESNLKTLEQFLGTPINPKALEEVKKAVSRETGWPECELVCEVDDRGTVTVSRETDKAEELPAYIDSSIYDFIQDSVYEELAENFRALPELQRYSPDLWVRQSLSRIASPARGASISVAATRLAVISKRKSA